jgi:hypothetical protein
MRYYAGVGSRKTPLVVQNIMVQAAGLLEDMGFILRSGGADGADKAFETGVRNGKKEIFYSTDSTAQVEEIASKIHPAWHRCNPLARKLHGRNVFQILGKDLKTPVEFVVCWTARGESIGGTRTAIVLAEQHHIPVYNLGAVGDLPRFDTFLNGLCKAFQSTLNPGIR